MFCKNYDNDDDDDDQNMRKYASAECVFASVGEEVQNIGDNNKDRMGTFGAVSFTD